MSPTPVRLAVAGMSHGHVIWLLRNLQRTDPDVVGFWEPDAALAQRYAARFGFSPELVFSDLDAMLDTL